MCEKRGRRSRSICFYALKVIKKVIKKVINFGFLYSEFFYFGFFYFEYFFFGFFYFGFFYFGLLIRRVGIVK
jgi:hypothetical protein